MNGPRHSASTRNLDLSGRGEPHGRQRLPLWEVASLVTKLVATFGRHHADPALAGEEALLAESAEMAWMVNEERERPGRPMKVAAELSTHENVMQTAIHAAVVPLRGRAHDRARGAGLVRRVQHAPPDAKR